MNRSRGFARRVRGTLLAALLVALAACSSEETPHLICDDLELFRALADAEPGDVISLGKCRIDGAFTVPAGVVLEGSGPETVIVSIVDQALIAIGPGEGLTTLTRFSVESSALAAIQLSGTGVEELVIDSVDLTLTRGIGITVENAHACAIRSVTLVGPMTPELAETLPPTVEPWDTATHGVALRNVGSAELTNVSSSNFASYGALITDSDVSWTAGQLDGNVSSGLAVFGGNARLEDITVTDTINGSSMAPSYGAVFVNGADLRTKNLVVSGGEGLGILQDGSQTRHVDLIVAENDRGGMWAQFCPYVELSGRETSIRDNGAIGIVFFESDNVVLSGGTFENTRTQPTVCAEASRINIGDGLNIVWPRNRVSLRDLTFTDNERVGLLVVLDQSYDVGLDIRDVDVSGVGSQLGAVLYGLSNPDGWDDGITRDAVTTANDAALEEPLDLCF